MKKEKIDVLISAVTIILLAGALFCGSAAQAAAAEAHAAKKASAEKVYKFRFQTIQAAYPAPEGSGLPDPFNYWAEMVREATNGRINIEIYGAGSLVPVADMFDATSKGIIDGMQTDASYYRKFMPIGEVSATFPFAYRNWDDAVHVTWDLGIEDLEREAYAEHGIHLISQFPTCNHSIISRKPIRGIDDIKGMKFRTFGTFLDLVRTWGGSTVFVSLPEVYTGLSLGTFDAVLTAYSMMDALKLYERARYVTPQPMSYGMNDMCLNLKKWNALPDDLKTILTLTTKEWGYWHLRAVLPYYSYLLTAELAKKGCTIVKIPDAEWEKMVETAKVIWDKIGASDARNAKGVAIIKDFLKHRGYID